MIRFFVFQALSQSVFAERFVNYLSWQRSSL